MKIYSSVRMPIRIAAAAFMVGAVTSVGMAADLQGKLVLRPLTQWDVTSYGLPSATEFSGGLSAVGVGQPLYLEAEVNIAVAASDVTNVIWTLSARPPGSSAALQSSPLGTNVPIYEPSERLVSQQVSRKLLRPDLAGQYTVTATIQTASNGTTNVTSTITAGTYMGVETCALCHSGGKVAPNKVDPWLQTLHATALAEGLDGGYGSHFGVSCLKCHTTGYDANTNAVNGGFDDLAAQHGWTFPTNLVAGNWASMQTNYPEVAALANVQCESCHGPGSQHAYSLGNTNLIAVNYTSGTCNQCHDAPTHHFKGSEWLNSKHAVVTRDPSGPGRDGCVGCHTGTGFIGRIDGASTLDTTYNAIGCQACHEPHGETTPAGNPHQIRAMTPVTFMDGTTVTNAGEGQLCIQCHHARVEAATYATSYHSRFGPHHGPQGDMLEGINGFTYGQAIPSSAHRNAVTNTCVTCHMQDVESPDPTFLNAGGHTFKVAWETATNTVDLVGACQKCHGATITDFDFPLQDFNGDGVIEGVQTEVQRLLDKVAVLLPPAGQPKTTVSPASTWTAPQLEAAYNYLFVQEDGSMGIHNTAYAVGLLKASIASLTGDANNDGIPDSWQLQYFSSINDPNAAPNATPAGDDVPNWLKYALGLNPMIPGVTLPDGVVWANKASVSGDTNSVQIFTAAEVAFNTEVGKTYQIQAISSLGGGWQNIGGPIAGTGASISYVTPTRNNSQQYFRVVHN